MESSHATTCAGRALIHRPRTGNYRGGPRRCNLQICCGESRIGKVAVPLPASVKTNLKGQLFQVEGPKGKLEWTLPDDVTANIEGERLVVTRVLDRKKSKAMHGLARALCSNMVIGVSEGYTKQMEMIGVGYRASVSGRKLTLSVGFCHPVILDIPEGVEVEVSKNTLLKITGYDKAIVGNFCAVIRRQRPPEPYKGKGIRFAGEVIRMKEGKKGK